MRFFFGLLLSLTFLASIATAAEEIKLPNPQKAGGPALFAAIDDRGSPGQNAFPAGELSQEDLATILWAATGNNRNGSKWTVPMAMGRPPYCKVYVALKSGIYLYNWKRNTLGQISDKDQRAAIPMQQFAKDAPAMLIIVVDNKALESFPPPLQEESGLVLAGAMSQNIYLACEGVGVGTRLVYSIKRDETSRLLELSEKETPVFALPMGKK